MISLLLLVVGCSSGFMITTSRPDQITVMAGKTVTLFCEVDADYEWCKFYHPTGKFCDFEWKRSKGNITMQECQMENKVQFHGAYDDRECGITFTAAYGDSGTWKCEIEEYVFLSSRGAGSVRSAEMKVNVEIPTSSTRTTKMKPTTSLTTKTTTTSTSTKRRTSTTTPPAMTQSETSTSIITTSEEPETTTTHVDGKTTITTFISEVKDTSKDSEDNPTAHPRVDNDVTNNTPEDMSIIPIIVSVVIIIIIIIAIVIGVLYYLHRKKTNASVPAVAYDKEDKMSSQHTDLDKNSITNITFLANNADRTNLHEFFPPKLTTIS